MASDFCVVIDNEDHRLSERPVSTSRVVLVARDQLLSQLDLTAVCDDLERVARIVNIARTAAYAAGQVQLAEHITALASQVTSLFDTTGVAIAKFKAAADAVLEELPANCDLVVQGDVQNAVLNFSSNDDLALELANTSEALANALQEAAERARGTVEQAMKYRGGAESERRDLLDRMNILKIQREAAWQAHTAVLESLTDSSRIFDAVAKREKRASRRARVYGLFSFIATIDGFLQSRLRFSILSPLTSVIHAVQRDAQHAQHESKMIMDSKRHQRKLNAETLYDLTVLSRRIREIKSDVDATLAAVESLHTVAAECKRLSVVVMRMSAFWRQVHSSMGRLSSREVVQLIEATIAPRTEAGECTDSQRLQRGGTGLMGEPASAGGFAGEDCEEIVIAMDGPAQTSSLERQEPCTALKRQIVQYYARWAALSEVCNDCIGHVASCRAEAVEELSTSLVAVGDQVGSSDLPINPGQATLVDGMAGTEEAKRAVEHLAARLRDEVAAIDTGRKR
jgi:hypothetical protein